MERLDVVDIPLQPRAAGAAVPLTASQRRVWNGLVDGMSGTRLGEASLRILGSLDIPLLRKSIEAVLHRHESLRTRIVLIEGTPRQQIDAARELELEVIDVSGGSAEQIDAELKRLTDAFVREKINLSVGPLFVAKLLRLSERDHVLMVGVDHIVADAASCWILRQEILTAYKQAVQGLPVALPSMPVQFADYAVWQELTHEAWRRQHEPYWRERLTGAPAMELPLDGRVPAGDPTWTRAELPLGSALSTKLRDLAAREQAQLPLVVLTIIVAVVARWSGQRDFVVTFVSHGRYARAQLSNTIGLFASFLHLRMQVVPGDSLLDLLRRVAREFKSAQEHYDFNRVPDLIPECKSAMYFNWASTNWTRQSAPQPAETVDQIDARSFPIRNTDGMRAAQWKLEFGAAPGDDAGAGVIVRARHRSDLLASSTIERLGRGIRSFAEALADHPLTAVDSLDVET